MSDARLFEADPSGQTKKIPGVLAGNGHDILERYTLDAGQLLRHRADECGFVAPPMGFGCQIRAIGFQDDVFGGDLPSHLQTSGISGDASPDPKSEVHPYSDLRHLYIARETVEYSSYLLSSLVPQDREGLSVRPSTVDH